MRSGTGLAPSSALSPWPSSADILQRSLNLVLLFSLVLGGTFGVALLLARGIVYLLKGSLRGHHPKELLDLYLQQDDLLNSIEDGLVATDLRGQVVFANDQARPCSSAAPPPGGTAVDPLLPGDGLHPGGPQRAGGAQPLLRHPGAPDPGQ